MQRIQTMLLLVDYMFSLFIVTPLVVSHWRGTWYVLDTYLFPSDPAKTAWVGAAAGTAGCLVYYLLQEPFKKAFRTPSRFHRVFTISLLSLVSAAFSISQFRGVWLLWEYFLGKEPRCTIASTVTSIVGAASLRVLPGFCVQPFGLAVDSVDLFFTWRPRFQTKPCDGENYFWDCLFTSSYVPFVIISWWQGVWLGLDLWYMFPTNLDSILAGLALGYGLAAILLLAQRPVAALSRRLDKRPLIFKAAVEQLFYLVTAFSNVCIWRGWWMGIDAYILTNEPVYSAWVTYAVGGLAMLVLRGSAGIMVRITIIAGEQLDGEGVWYAISYFQTFYQCRREKRENAAFEQSQQAGRGMGVSSISNGMSVDSLTNESTETTLDTSMSVKSEVVLKV